MFGKLTKEEKEKFRKHFQAIIDPVESASPVTSKVDPSGEDKSSDDDDNTNDAVKRPETNQHADTIEEIMRIDSQSEVVEINNVRLFSLNDVELNKLIKCKELCLRKNLIHELSPIPEHLANRVTKLDLFDNKIKKIGNFFTEVTVPDGEPVENPTEEAKPLFKTISSPNAFSSIAILDLSYNQIKKISGLDSLAPTLKELYLVENKIREIINLDKLVNLELLELGGNRIREIGDGLKNLTKLKFLWMGKNKIADLNDAFSTLSSLELLSLQANRITKLMPENFSSNHNPNLRELYLSENGIEVIEHIESLSKLQLLDFSFNPIKTINESIINPQNYPELKEFWLTDGKIESWDEISKFSGFSNSLRTVYFERNPIEDDKRYRDKVYLHLPFLEQIDSWPIVNKGNLEADRSIQRKKSVAD